MGHLPIRVILVEPEKPGNLGAIARSMKNFDFEDLWIVNPKTSINAEARAFAMRGLEILNSAKIVGTLSEALEEVDVVAGTSSVTARSSSNLSRVAITADQFAEKIAHSRGIVGIVFGRESSGLNNREVEACDFMMTIPASHSYNVLNIATAASIIFYEIFLSRATRNLELASRMSKRRLLLEFGRIVRNCGVQSHKRRLVLRAFRNVISRSFLSKREASLLLGAFRKAASKLL